jgi:glycosyltransferase involved in cell wall biosynthesis
MRFLPPMPAREAFALAELVVVPSRAEAMPYIVLETLAAGKSMIATAVGGIPEIFGVGSPALIRPDPRELSNKMSAALADLNAYGSLMPDTADLKTRFGADVMAAAIETAYFAALKR